MITRLRVGLSSFSIMSSTELHELSLKTPTRYLFFTGFYLFSLNLCFSKAVIADYFPQNEVREVAFATVYFSSGLAGAMGFAFFQFLDKYSIAVVNLVVSFVAICSFLSAQALHDRERRQQKVAMVSTLVTVVTNNEDAFMKNESKANSVRSVDEDDDMLKSATSAMYQRNRYSNAST